MKGVPLKLVSGRLRHSGIKITADIYGHITREADQQAANEMRNIYLLEKVLNQ